MCCHISEAMSLFSKDSLVWWVYVHPVNIIFTLVLQKCLRGLTDILAEKKITAQKLLGRWSRTFTYHRASNY